VIEQALVVQYLRRWQVERANILADRVAACGGAQLPEPVQMDLAAEKDNMPVSPALAENRAIVRALLGASEDVMDRPLYVGSNRLPACLFYVNGMADRTQIMLILEALTSQSRNDPIPPPGGALNLETFQQLIPSATITGVGSMGQVLEALLNGDSVLFVEGLTLALVMPTDGLPKRQPDEPTTEPTVRGPKDGFTESHVENLALIRRRLRDDRLRVEKFTLGTRTHTTVLLVYLLGLAEPGIVNEVRRRVSRIQVDSVLESGYIEELIEDESFTLFPLVKITERPDVVVAGMLEGKVALITDGTPHVMLMPSTLVAELQAAEDYYDRWPTSSFIRTLRIIYVFIAFLGPATYVAITTYHQELIPTNLLITLITAREGVPFPAVIEALAMELTMEALREAGVRLPKVVGQAISIVGALVIGDSAVQAGLVSPVMVVVVALTAIASFIIPLYAMSLAVRVLRFAFVVLAGVFGFFGIVVGLMALYVHLVSLRSFGVPYLSPMIPPSWGDQRDVAVRVPWWAMRRRPRFMPLGNRSRMGLSNRPHAPERKEGGKPGAATD